MYYGIHTDGYGAFINITPEPVFNKANLRDLIAATGLVIWLKLEKNGQFSARVTLKFDQKIIGHLFYITSSLVHHLKSLGEFKLELLFGNVQFASNSAIFCPVLPWNLMDDFINNRSPLLCYVKLALYIISKPSVNSNWSYSLETLNSGQNRTFCVPCDLEIWWVTSENNRAPLYVASSFVQHFIAIGEFKLKLQSGNAQFGSKSTIILAVWPWKLTDDLEKQ